MTVTLSTDVRTEEAYEYVEFVRLGGDAVIYLDGERIGDNAHRFGRTPYETIRPYRFYLPIPPGEHTLTVESVQREGSEPPISGTVKLGRLIDDPWRVRLHFGRARVFVKTATPDAVEISARIVKQ